MLKTAITIGLIQLTGAMLPGVDFALVVKNALYRSRRAGVYTAAGIASGIIVHLCYSFLGVIALLQHYPNAFQIFKLICAGYLFFIGVNLLKHPIVGQDVEKAFDSNRERDSAWQSFKEGFFCNVFNPKVVIFFLSLFTMILQDNPSWALRFGYGLEIVLITFTWFSLLAFLITMPLFKRTLDKLQKVISYTLGVLLVLLACSIFYF